MCEIFELRGLVVNTAVVIASAEGVLMQVYSCTKMPTFHLIDGWTKYLLQQMGFGKRKATIKAKLSVEDFEVIKKIIFR